MCDLSIEINDLTLNFRVGAMPMSAQQLLGQWSGHVQISVSSDELRVCSGGVCHG